MEINATVNVQELFDYDGERSSEEIFKELLQNAVKQAFREKFSSEIELAMNNLMPKLVSTLELKLQEKVESFFAEDIAISDRWGNPTFVGSIEDLMKQKFDETILAPVNGKGENVSGCASPGTKTYAEYIFEKKIDSERNYQLDAIVTRLEDKVNQELKGQLAAITDGLIHTKVANALAGLLADNNGK